MQKLRLGDVISPGHFKELVLDSFQNILQAEAGRVGKGQRDGRFRCSGPLRVSYFFFHILFFLHHCNYFGLQVTCEFFEVWATLNWSEYFKDDPGVFEYQLGGFTKRDETYHQLKFCKQQDPEHG